MVENYEDPIRKAPPAKILILTPNPDEIISHARSSLPEDLTIFRGSPGRRTTDSSLPPLCYLLAIYCQ